MSQIAQAQCTTTLTVIPGLCTTTANTYSTTAIVTLSNPTTGILTITDGSQSATFATTPISSATFTALFTGLISNGDLHTVTAALFGCTPSTATYTAPGSCTQPAGTQLALTKLVDKTKAKIGDVMTYTLVLTNTGSTTATNVVVQDSMSTGLSFVPGSATIPSGTTFTQGAPKSTWKIGALSTNQSFSLTYQAIADSSGVLYNQATIAGDTATVCTSIPVLFCAGDTYVIQLTAAPGRSSYRWFRDDVELTSQTTNILTITAPGTYSLAVDNVSGKCPDFSCCPFIVEEDTLPTFQAIAVPVTCVGNAALTNGQIVLSNFRPGYTYQYSFGADFNPAASLSGPAKAIPVGGVIVNNIANPGVAQSYTIRVYNASGCYTDVTVVMLPAICCNVSVVATPGLCAPLTSTYSTTALISLTNPPSGTLTLSDGPKSLTFATTAGSSTTFTATFDNLISDGTSHTVVLSLPGCSTTSTTYTAPASCNIGLGLAVTDPGVCLPGTNTYNTTGVISLISAVAGTATITDGASTTTLSINAGATSVPYSLSGLPSGTGLHTVTVNYLGQTASTTYTAPASCSVSPICSISVVATPGLCQIATNTFTTVALINITNPTTGIVTVSDGPASLTFATTAGSSASFTATLANIISDGASHTLTASLPGCSTTTTTYTAPASCSIAPSVCNLSAVATAGLCSTVTHTYSVSVVINLTNAQPGSLIVDVFGAASSSQAVSNGTNSFTLVFDNLIPDGLNRTITVSLPGCGTTTASFTAPVSCSAAPVCSLNAVATAGLCSTATNTYSSTVVITLTNPTAGTLSVTHGGQTQTLLTTSATTTLTATFDNLISDGASHTVLVSLPGCSTTSATYTAPASCSVAPLLAAVITPGNCNSATNQYTISGTISLTAAIAGTITISDATASTTLSVSAGQSSASFSLTGLTAGTGSHTVTISAPGYSPISLTYSAPASCSVGAALSVTPGLCQSATNQYSISGMLSLTNAVVGTATLTDGVNTTTLSVSAGATAVPYSLSGLPSGTGLHTVTVSYLGQTASTTYTAPASCSVALVCRLSAAVTAGLCSTATNTYSSTVIVTLTNPTAGTLTITHGGQTQTLLTTSATTTLTATFDNLISDGNSHTLTASLPGCSTTTTTYTAPASCSIAPSVCNLSAVATAGLCSTVTHTYSVSVVINLTNAQPGSLIVDVFGAASSSQAVSNGTNSFTLVFDNLIPDGLNRTITVSLPGCGTTTASFTAPVSCSVAPVCSISAVATPGLCSTATNTYSSTVVVSLTNPTTGTLTVTNGGQSQTLVSSQATTSLTTVFDNLISDGSSHTATVSLSGCGTTTATFTAPASCSVAPICSLSAVATAGLCASATNTYSSTVIVTLTNPTAGTLTITHGGQTQTLLTTSATTTLTATFDNLISDGNSHTVLVSLPGCSTTSASYTAPTSCRVELGLAITDPGVCLPGTNTYNTTGVISLTNAVAGTATITDGTSTTTIAISAGATSVPYSLSGLPSGTGSHTVTVSYLGQSASTTYTAPASCSVAPVCSLSATATAGLCATATNTYSASIVVSLTNTTAGMITISLPGTTPVSQTLAANTPTFTAVFQDLPSDGATHTATISLPGCSTTSATYTAPVSCSVAPVCSISAVATPGLCQSATNTFTNTVVVSLTNPQTGILTVTDGPASLTFAAVAGSSGSFTATFSGISSTGASHTVTTSLPGCSTISTTYTAPVSCSLAPVCSLSATATAGLCATATNTYSATAVIQLTNPTAGVLTVTAGVQSATFVTTTAPSATFTVVFPGLLSDGATHTITASLPSCSSITATYTAPTSCSVAPVCSISAVVTPGLCQTATNTFTTVALINITNPTTGILTVSDGPASLTFATVAGGSASFTATLANIISDGASHTLTATLPDCSTTSTTYTAPASCSIAPPVCSLSAVATAGLCSTATNTYSSTVVITLTNPTAGTLSVTHGGQTQTLLTTSATTTLTATFDNLISDGASHTVLVSLPGCSTTSATYTAPASCSVAPLLAAVITPGNCNSATNQYTISGTISLTAAIAGTITISDATASTTLSVSAGQSSASFSLTGLTAGTGSHTVTISAPGYSPISLTYSAPASCSVGAALSVTPGLCQSATNQYSISGMLSLTNAVVGTATLTDGVNTTTLSVSAGATSVPYSLSGLISGTGSHTVTISYLGQTASTTYTAPASCSVAPVCRLSAAVTAGLCATATNTYSSTVIVTLTNPTAGTLTITHGGQTQTLLTTSATTTLTATFDNLISDGNSHTVVVSLPGCSTTSASYTAPTSCRVEVGLAITDPGVCLPGTNTYNTTGVISLTNAVAGTATITDGTSTTTIAISAGATSVPYSLSGLPSGTGSHTVTVSYLGQSASTTYTAPASCSVAPVCSLSATATAGLCATATNTYSASIVVSLTNTTAGMITISLPGTTPVSQTLAANTPTFTAVFQDLPSDGATHTATISLPGCSTTSATYTAPVSCSVAPVCSISAVATPGLCQSATNTFTNTVVVSLTNPQTGILTVTDGPASLTFAAVAGSSGSFTATFSGISSTGASHTVTTSLPGCSTISTTYTAPVSCSLAPVCSLSATATAGLCATATNTYSATAVIQLTNPTAGVLTVTAGVQSATFVTTTAPSATFTVVFPGLLSDGATHTITASLPSCSSITATYTAPTSCSVAPVCSISAVVTPGLCQTATNTFTTVALINITNPTTGILTVSDGPASLTFATVAGGSASFTATLANIISDGASHTLTATLPGCSTTSTTYTAPASCSIAPPVCSLSAVATAGLCSTATNTYSSTVVITLTNPTAGTLTVTNGGQTQTLLTTSATTTLTATFDNLISDGASHTVVVSLPGCSTASTTYTAPTSCRVELGLAITDPGVCLPGTNTYNTTGVINLTNAIAGLATLVDGSNSLTLAVSAGATSIPYSMSGLISGTGTHTVTVSYLGQSASTTYTAPASCSVVCSVTAVATAIPVTCAGNSALQNGKIAVSGFTDGDTYQYSGGTVFNPAVSLSGPAQVIPAGGVIVSNLANPMASQPYTVRIYSGQGCYKDSTVMLLPTVCTCPAASCVPLVIKQTKGARRYGVTR